MTVNFGPRLSTLGKTIARLLGITRAHVRESKLYPGYYAPSSLAEIAAWNANVHTRQVIRKQVVSADRLGDRAERRAARMYH